MQRAVIIDGIRTPFGSFGGSLKDIPPVEMGVKVVKGLIKKINLDPKKVDQLIFGSVIQSDAPSLYLGRHIVLGADLPHEVPGLTVNRLCGSGMESVIQAAMQIQLGLADSIIAGGVENMSRAPFVAQGARWGNRLGSNQLEDILHVGLLDSYNGIALGITAENLAERYNVSREEQDEWACISQTRAAAARDNGRFAEEILPVRIRTREGRGTFEKDEFIRGPESCDKLKELPCAFKSDGTVTAGNASGINDGASVLHVVSEGFAEREGLKPLSRIIGWGSSGCDPACMGIGPVHAIPPALKMAGVELKDLGLIEINEAYAAQFLAVAKTLGLNPEITNVNGGAVALGHPLGASGNRLLLTLSYEMQKREVRYALASLCIGGGQGIAMVLERVV